ncbi:MAG: hypothetical protein ACT4QG_11400 [Sporichthyaceae bacterium]
MRISRTFASGTAGLLAVGAWAALPPASARAESTYAAVARANGFELAISNPSIPTGIAIEGGGPAAAARQDSLGVRDAGAQFPYAGDTVPGLPATGAALFGFPAPAYPFLASSNAGSDPQTISYPGVNLHAESGDFTTLATARGGDNGLIGVLSSARVDENRDGDVISTASTSADAVKLGPYATLNDVRTVATVVANGATGKVTRTTTTSVGRISVPGLDLEIPKQTPAQVPIPVPIPGVPNQAPFEFPPVPFPAGGENLHNPDIGIQDGYFTVTGVYGGQKQTYAVSSDTVLAALEQAGITVSFQAPMDIKNGISSGTYRFEYTAAAPPENGYYNGATKFAQSTASVVASVDLNPVPAAAAPPSLIPPIDGVPVAPPADVLGAPLDAGALPAEVPAVASIPAPAAAQPAPRATDTVALSVQQASGPLPSGADNLYLVVVGIAGLGFLAAAGVSMWGVRS